MRKPYSSLLYRKEVAGQAGWHFKELTSKNLNIFEVWGGDQSGRSWVHSLVSRGDHHLPLGSSELINLLPLQKRWRSLSPGWSREWDPAWLQ
jgi:hypothetical protein